MKDYQNILVAVSIDEAGDYRPPSQEALDRGLWLAEQNGGEVTLITAVAEGAVETEAILEEAGSQSLQVQRIHADTMEMANSRGITVHSIVKQGRPWLEIIQAVLQENFDVVIVGARQQGFANRMLFGTTATRLLRKCPCPVWVTRPSEEHEIKTVVAADDLTEMGEQVLRTAVSSAQLLHARLLVVNAVNFPLLGGMRRTEASEVQLNEYKEQVKSDAERNVHDRLALTDYRTIQEGTQILIQPGAADVVIENAITEHKADLLVMGTIARGGIPGLLVGNTAERLLPQLTCSVLALKPQDFQCPVS